MSLTRYMTTLNIVIIALMSGLFLFGDLHVFVLTYIAIFVFATARLLNTEAKKRTKLYLFLSYNFALVLQTVACVDVLFSGEAPSYERPVRRLLAVALVLLPLVVSRYISAGKYAQFYLPSLQDLSAISFSEIKSGAESVAKAVKTIEKAGERLSPENLKAVAYDLKRHDSFRYINNGSLTEGYFAEAERSMSDPYLYIVISSTGSPASEIISVFTQKQYNHASISFDRDLKTIISYNGGERAYPPGLNKEMLDFFHKKPDASILVYKLPCTWRQKRIVLDKIADINRDGSAYNMMGLVFKYSHKPNIMFCSQFVYRMLDCAGLNYFSRDAESVKPTDFIEQDYFRKLIFDCEIRFDQRQLEADTTPQLKDHETERCVL